jgi:hypothetical protein
MAKPKMTDDEMSDFMDDLYSDESPANDNVQRHRLKGRTLDELANLRDPQFILPGIVPEGLTVIYSYPKRGKTFWTIELTTCFTARHSFHGIELPTSGNVLYISPEGTAASLRNRAETVIKKRNMDRKLIVPNWVLVDSPIDLNDRASCDEVLAQNPGPFNIVVVDTLQSCMSGNESGTQDMSEAVNNFAYIARELKARARILLHHEGKNKDLRGALALYGALDCLIHLTRADGVTTVTVEDARDFEVPEKPSQHFVLTDGTLEPTDPGATGVAALEIRESAMRDILVRLCSVSRKDGPATTVPDDQWRAACDSDGHLTGSKKTKDKQWERARKKLVEAELIRVTGKQVQPWQSAPDEFKDDD